MVYRVTGIINNSSDKTIRIIFTELEENRGQWKHTVLHQEQFFMNDYWTEKLSGLYQLPVTGFFLLHDEFGKYLGQLLNQFIAENKLEFRVQLIGMTGYPVVTAENKILTELGNGAMVAAETGINTVCGFADSNRSFGGNGRNIFSVVNRLLHPGEAGDYDECIAVALLAVLRWREENNIDALSTGAARDCIAGAVWTGQEA